MSFLPVNPDWTPRVTELQRSDPVLGGPGGPANIPHQELADRTEHLKVLLDTLQNTIEEAALSEMQRRLREIEVALEALADTEEDGTVVLAVPNATTTQAGKVRLATIQEAQAKTAQDIAVTPAGLAHTHSEYAAAGHTHPAGDHNHAASAITSGTFGVARGGTGAASFTANSLLKSGASTTAAITTATGGTDYIRPADISNVVVYAVGLQL
jgi:hypothetical protein